MKSKYLLSCLFFMLSNAMYSQKIISSQKSGNPVFPGWYADPEAAIFNNSYWVYPTCSAPYNQQIYLDAFSSVDLVQWTKHPHITDTSKIKWAKRALWAPAIVEKKGGITCSLVQMIFSITMNTAVLALL